MRRYASWSLLLALAALLAAPGACAAAEPKLDSIDVENLDGEPLEFLGTGDRARFQIQFENAGDADFEGELAVTLAIGAKGGDAGSEENTLEEQLTIPEGKTANLTYEWTPRKVGDYTITVQFEAGANDTQEKTFPFTVKEHAVLRTDNLVERLIQYGWVYGGFLLTFVLFVAVVRLRKPQD